MDINKSRSLFNIRQDHLNILTSIEENEGEINSDALQALALTENDFKEKAISYAFMIQHFKVQAEVIDKEIARLTARRAKVEGTAETFATLLDAAMKQFKYDKIDSPLLSISYRKSVAVELSESFADSILKYTDVSVTLSGDKIATAVTNGERPAVTADVLQYFDVKVTPSKKRISEALKGGVCIPGARIEERKNLQIK